MTFEDLRCFAWMIHEASLREDNRAESGRSALFGLVFAGLLQEFSRQPLEHGIARQAEGVGQLVFLAKRIPSGHPEATIATHMNG